MEYIQSCHPEGCQECPLGKQMGAQVVHPITPKDAKVLFIGDMPGKDDVIKRTHLNGNTGQLLRQIFKEVEIDETSVAISNIVCCRPPDNRQPNKKEINTCIKHLYKEIEQLKPELIVLLGSTPLKTIFPSVGGITKARGELYDHPELNCKVLPVYSPSYILRSPFERSKLVSDLKKASDFIAGKITITERKPVSYYTVTNRTQLDWTVEQLHANKLWACDTETTSLNPLEAEIFIITFSWASQTSVLLDSRYFIEDKEYFWSKVKEVMTNDSVKVFQNGGYDIQCFFTHNIKVVKYLKDTLLMHYLLDENVKHGLKELAWEHTDMGGYDVPLDKYVKEHKPDTYKDIPLEIIHPYAAADADVTLRAYQAMQPMIEKEGLSFVHDNVMIPTQKILAMTEYNGVSIDVPYLDKTIISYTERMAAQLAVVNNVPQVRQYEYDETHNLKKELEEHWVKSKTLSKKYPVFDDYVKVRLEKKPDMLKFSFNINSPNQLKELLIERMGLPILKKTPTGGACTDGGVLEEYAKTNAFCESIAKFRTLSHLKSTFLDGIKNRLTSKNKVHTDYYLWSTVTGRPSSRDPNLNNIPRTGTADDIKDIFCCDPDTDLQLNWLAEVDGAQAEFRMWINYAKDPQALYDLGMGIDIHKLMAAGGKGRTIPRGNLSPEQYYDLIYDITKAERQAAKMVVFGLMYGRGAASVAKQLGISKAQAEVIIAAFFGRYTLAHRWLKTTVAYARRDGYSGSLFGRKRRLIDILATDSGKRSEAERQAVNAPIQSAASDLTFLAAIRIHRHLWAKNMKTRLVLTVYDSLIFNIPDEELQEMVQLMKIEMERKPIDSIIVPLAAEISIGTHWGSLLEIDSKEEWSSVYNKLIEHKIKTAI